VTELTIGNAPEWLEAWGFPPVEYPCEELGGGVSNKVIFAPVPGRSSVLKQALGKLRVEQEWLSDPARIFREAAAMRWLEGKIEGGRVPRILAEDRANFVISMESAPPSAEMWKTRLFRGELEASSARSAGSLLGSLIAVSWNQPEARHLFGDQTVFDQLRIDPYYRSLAARHPELSGYVNTLIARSAGRRVSLVHGDWSPKNLLVAGSELWAIDWEVVHYGDPSYDVAFLLNHLLLKSIALPQHRVALASLAEQFLSSLRLSLNTRIPAAETDWLEPAAIEHLPALLLARVAGKSPAEYLDAGMRAAAWKLGLDLISQPATSLTEAFAR
jgi:streptomycin 6-kinase